MKKIVAFSGSNSSKSVNQELIRLSSELVKNSEIEVIDLREFEAPVYGVDMEQEKGIPESMKALWEKFESADAFIVSTPEHNGSMPAVLKNTIDWLSRISMKPFGDKPTLFMAASPGPRGGMSALNHLVSIMPFRGAKVVGHLSVGNYYDQVSGHQLTDELSNQISALIGELESQLN